MSGARHVVVVGGGISGLSAAQRLAGRPDVAVTLVEADTRLGGKIRTETFAGQRLDFGAEALLARVPAARELCAELGLEDALVTPGRDRAYVWTDRLRPLPARLLAGAPASTRALIASGLLSPAGLARAGLDLVVPARRPRADQSIGTLVRRRLGAQVLERLVDPLLGGIHAGSCEALSVRATAPQLEAALHTRRSLVRGLRALAGPPAGPVFETLRGGLGLLTGALETRLADVAIETGVAVARLDPCSGGGVLLALSDGRELHADHAILALPAFAAAAVLADACLPAAAELATIDYASVATIALAYPGTAVGRPLDGSGFLVPRGRGRTITACTWSSAKWPHLAGDHVLLKCATGRAGDRRALDLDDDALVDAARRDLAEAMDVRGAPLAQRVERFERAIPQYAVGHAERVARIDTALAPLQDVSLCGAAYRGVGVGACIRDGRAAAARALAGLPALSCAVPVR